LPPGWQAVPDTHETQAPALQTWVVSPPQGVPLSSLPASVHTGSPVVQAIVPFLHSLVGSHDIPAVQGPHVPLWQTLLSPQAVPLGLLLSLQTGTPVEHEVVPVLHGFVTGQLAPTVQALQVPLPHTMFVPQEVPFALLPVSLQTSKPVVQENVPVLHMFAGWQLAPIVHELQVPPPHTLFVPQDVPSSLLPVSLHIIVPVEHEFAPVLHMFSG
jgi:hypothetical protein